MEKENLYYTPPPIAQFNELKEMAMDLWVEVAREPRYAEGKIARIKDIKNIGDNFMYMVAMFDQTNQAKLSSKLSVATRTSVRDRIIAGGAEPWEVRF